MPDRRILYVSLTLATWIMTAPKAHALLTFDDGKDKVFVTATYSFGYDTNVFTQKVAQGAVTEAFSLSATYSRRAGVISVDASTGFSSGTFSGLLGQAYNDPNLAVTFTKGTGRTTGSLGISVAENDVPDPVANNRARSWNYSGDLNLRYPVNERYYFTDTLSGSETDYLNKVLYFDSQSLNNAFDVNYVYDSKLDLNGGYVFGLDTTKDTIAIMNGYSVGASGSILPKLSGSLSFGQTWDDAFYSNARFEGFQDWTATTALKWAFSRSLTFSGSVTKGFSISSTDISTDSTTATLSADMALGKRLRGTIGVDYIPTRFLGRKGAGRKDYLWEVPVTLYTAITTHIRVSLSYAYEVNYSNFSSARFTAEVVTLSITATY
jgi:hypothetical protein